MGISYNRMKRMFLNDLRKGYPKYLITRDLNGDKERYTVCQYDISSPQWSGKEALNSTYIDV